MTQKQLLEKLNRAAQALADGDYTNHRASWEFTHGYHAAIRNICVEIGISQEKIDKADEPLNK